MIARRFMGWVLVVWSVLALTLGAEQVSAPEVQAGVALAHRVEHLKAAFRSGDDAKVEEAAKAVEQLRRRFGTLDMTPLVEAMAVWARDLDHQGQTDLAHRVLHRVEVRWAPKHPTLLATRIVLHRRAGIKGYFFSLPDIWELTRMRLSHPDHRWLWIAQHAGWIRTMAALLLWGLTLALMLRYRRVLRYLWEDPLSKQGLGSTAIAVLGAFLLALPVVIGLDPSVAACVALILLAPFLTPTEVRAALLIVAFQWVHPIVGLLDPLASQSPVPSIVALQHQPQARSLFESGVKRLPEGDQAFLRGWQQLAAQDWSTAEATFDALATTHPDRGAVLNNRGVARYQQGKVAEAAQDFDAAFQLLPDVPEVLVNQSVVAFRRLDSSLGIAKQDEARRLDPDRVSALMAANQAGTDQRTFPIPLPDRPERLSVLTDQPLKTVSLAEHLKTPPMWAGWLMPLLTLVLFQIRLRRSISRAHPSQCVRCGDPFHTTDSPDGATCSRCHHLFVLKDGLHGESRRRKIEEVGAFQSVQRFIHRTLLVLLPGADLCFMGHTGAGLLELSAWALALGTIVATGRTVRYPGEILADPASTWLPIGVLLLVILYLRSWLKLLPRRP